MSTKEKDNGYAICFNAWLDDIKITKELNLLLRISSLTAKDGVCFASNEYFATKLNIREETVSRKIKKLKDLGYIIINYKMRGSEIIRRFIRLTKMSMVGCEKNQWSDDQKVKDKNTSVKSTSIKENIYTKDSPEVIEIANAYYCSLNLPTGKTAIANVLNDSTITKELLLEKIILYSSIYKNCNKFKTNLSTWIKNEKWDEEESEWLDEVNKFNKENDNKKVDDGRVELQITYEGKPCGYIS